MTADNGLTAGIIGAKANIAACSIQLSVPPVVSAGKDNVTRCMELNTWAAIAMARDAACLSLN
jgi:hypothetical protein